MTCGYLLNKSSFRSSVEFVLVFSGTLNMYVLLLITLNSRHLCFNRGVIRGKSTGYVLLPNFYYQVLYRTDFGFWHQRVVSVCQELFSPRQSRGSHVRSCFGFYDGGAINLSVRCVGPSAVFCAVRNSVCQDSVRERACRVSLYISFPVLHRHAVRALCVHGQTASVRLSQNAFFSHWLIS